MEQIVRTNSDNEHFIKLVQELDAYLAEMDGEEHDFYAAFNKISHIRYVVLLFLDDQPAGCGAIKEIEPGVMEVKRMYTRPVSRNRGVAKMILLELEKWASELGASRLVLETGKRQVEAVGLYQAYGFSPMANYGQYAGVENSLCFSKQL